MLDAAALAVVGGRGSDLVAEVGVVVGTAQDSGRSMSEVAAVGCAACMGWVGRDSAPVDTASVEIAVTALAPCF